MTSLRALPAALWLLGTAALPAGVHARTVVLHPVGGSVIAEGGGLVVGFTSDPNRRDIELTLNGKAHRVKLWDGVFDIDLDWAKGDNTLDVAGQQVKFRYDPYAETLRSPSVHGAMLQNCGNCHVLGPERDLALKDQTDRLCLGCHGKKLAYAHPGAGCRGCHAPHTSWLPVLAKGETKDLCLGCHSKRVVAEGVAHREAWSDTPCTSCHRPHQPRAQTVGNQCRRCHQDRAAASPAHGPTVETACSTCHEVHASSADRRRKPTKDACGGCHPPAGDANHDSTFAACGDCHSLHAPRTVEAVGPRCAPCHQTVTGKTRLHGPDALGQCQECHPLHDLKNRSPGIFSCSGCHGMEKIAGGHTGAVLGFHTCVQCHRLHQSEEPFFLPQEQHAPFRKGGCPDCHDEAGFGRDRKYRAAWGDLCRKCHETKAGAAHDPAREGRCNACHDPHGSGWKGLLTGEPSALCLACHPGVPVSADTQSTHGKDTPCTRCHDPHGSGSPKHLRTALPDLCTTCHADPTLDLGGVAKPYVHGPLNLEGCSLCHTPHRVTEEPGLLRQPRVDVCASCHEEFGPAALARTGKTVHAPLLQGRCTGCHDPHASSRASLLKADGNALCTGCHNSGRHSHSLRPTNRHQTGAATPADWPLDQGQFTCTGCHEPHVAGSARLLAKGGKPALCRACHSTF